MPYAIYNPSRGSTESAKEYFWLMLRSEENWGFFSAPVILVSVGIRTDKNNYT